MYTRKIVNLEAYKSNKSPIDFIVPSSPRTTVLDTSIPNYNQVGVSYNQVAPVTKDELVDMLTRLGLTYKLRQFSPTNYKIDKLNIYLPKCTFNIDNLPKSKEYGIEALEKYLSKIYNISR